MGGADDILRVEFLGAQHDRSGFESGVEPLDRYFQTQAGQDARKKMAAPFVLVLKDGSIAGFYTLSSYVERPAWQGLFQTVDHTGTVRSYVRPFSAVINRWPR